MGEETLTLKITFDPDDRPQVGFLIAALVTFLDGEAQLECSVEAPWELLDRLDHVTAEALAAYLPSEQTTPIANDWEDTAGEQDIGEGHVRSISGELPPPHGNWYQDFRRDRQMSLGEAPLPVHPKSAIHRLPQPPDLGAAGRLLAASEEEEKP